MVLAEGYMFETGDRHHGCDRHCASVNSPLAQRSSGRSWYAHAACLSTSVPACAAVDATLPLMALLLLTTLCALFNASYHQRRLPRASKGRRSIAGGRL